MTAKKTIARLRERIRSLVSAGCPVDVVVWTGPALHFTQPLRCFTHPVGKKFRYWVESSKSA